MNSVYGDRGISVFAFIVNQYIIVFLAKVRLIVFLAKEISRSPVSPGG